VPEGDTVHKIANAMRPLLAGRPLESLWLRDRGELAAARGAVVEEVAALGKHFLFALGRREVLHVHLGIDGRWFRVRAGDSPPRADRGAVLRLATAADRLICVRAPVAELLRRADLRVHPVLAHLGPDLLAPEFDAARAVARARRIDARSVADLLLDQRAACGIGNVYKSEVLFAEGVDPWTPPGALDDARLAALYERARAQLRSNLGGWPRTTVRAVRPGDPWPEGQPRVFVYGRAGERCLCCAGRIESRRQGDGARTTYWCPRCQPDSSVVSASARSSPRGNRAAR
jgi:endonuclease VIII